MMEKLDIWLANLNPSKGTEVGKIRPVLVLQFDLFNHYHPSTIICPLSSNPWEEKTFYIFAQADEVGMDKNAVMLLDQLRALDNRRFIQKLGKLPDEYHSKVNQSLQIILDLI